MFDGWTLCSGERIYDSGVENDAQKNRQRVDLV